MKKLFPDAPDVAPGTAQRAAKIVEKHLRLHRAEKAGDLPEEAKVRLYRDLRFLFETNTMPGSKKPRSRIGSFFGRLWEKIDDFLST